MRELEAQLVEARDAGTGTLFEAKRKAQAKVYFGLRSLLLSQLRACFLSWAQASQTLPRRCIAHPTPPQQPLTPTPQPSPPYSRPYLALPPSPNHPHS